MMIKQINSKNFFACLLVLIAGLFLTNPASGQSWGELNNQGIAAFRAKDYAKAHAFFGKAKVQAVQEFGKKHTNYGTALSNLAAAYRESKLYDKATPLYKEALAVQAIALGKTHPTYGHTVKSFGTAYLRQQKFAQAENLYQQILKVYRQSSGVKNANYTFFLERLALTYVHQHKYYTTEKLYKVHYPLYKQAYADNSQEWKLFRETLGHLYDKPGLYPKPDFFLCKEYLKFKIKSLNKNNNAYLKYSLRLGYLYYTYERYSQAEKIYVKLHKAYKILVTSNKGNHNNNYYNTFINLFVIYTNQEKHQKAEELLKELNLLLKLNMAYHLRATLLSNVAGFYHTQGLFDQAESFYKKALLLFKDDAARQRNEYAIVVSNLSLLHYDRKKYDKALPLCQEALALRKKILGVNHADYILSLHNLAALYDAKEQYKKSESLYHQINAFRKKQFGIESTSYAQSLYQVAGHYFKQGLLDKAENNYKEAIRIYKQVTGGNTPKYARMLSSLGYLYYYRKQLKKAKSFYEEMIDQQLYFLKHNIIHLSESEKKKYIQSTRQFSQNFVRYAIDYLAKHPEDKSLAKKLFNLRLANKSQLLNAKRRLYQLIKQSGKKELLKKLDQYKLLKAQFAIHLNLSKTEHKKRGIVIHQNLQDIKTLEAELSKAVGVDTSGTSQVTFSDIQKSLKDNEASLEIMRFERYEGDYGNSARKVLYMALIASKNLPYPHLITFGKGEQMDKAYVKYYRRAVQGKKSDLLSYQRFWQPIARYLKAQKINKIYFSPDGVYNQINLTTLFNPNTNKYTGEEFDLHAVSNLKNIIKYKSNKRHLPPGQKIYLFGRPDYNMPVKALEQHEQTLASGSYIAKSSISKKQYKNGKQTFRSGWDDLPGTEQEVQAIGSILKKHTNDQVITRLKNQALEKALKQIQSPKILHIATHGFFIEKFKAPAKEKKEEVIFDNFSRGGTQTSFNALRHKITQEEPMLRSGIVLAGAASYEKATNKPNTEDGILTAYEASAMDLRNTDLVVLSACETGLGEVENGEGVYGLQRAFMVAGAKSLLMSLWKVDDTATQMLMSKFYELWIGKKQSKRAAFGAAQKYLRNYKKAGESLYASPYYWGAFVMVGE